MAREAIVDVEEDSDFSLDNLPYGVFRLRSDARAQIGVAIGAYVLKLAACAEGGLFDECRAEVFSAAAARRVFGQPTLNAFMELGRPAWTEARRAVQTALDKHGSGFALLREAFASGEANRFLCRAEDVVMLLPVHIGDYTDFYASLEHASNLGAMMRGPGNELMPNWRHLPVAYHGRASSIVVSGTDVRRPRGQLRPGEADDPVYAPSRLLDLELEVGVLIARDSKRGEPVPIEQARDYLFGLVLVNDWSARDVQKWEYQPLGPFNAKNFATTVSPWVITLEALEPYRVAAPAQQPPVLPYLDEGEQRSTLDIALRVLLNDTVVSRTNFRYLYWTLEQMVVHHTSTGCNLRCGDLLASGTISGPEPSSYGSLIELSWRGTRDIVLNDGSTRKFLLDGDAVSLRGRAGARGRYVGFGRCDGRILPAMEGGATAAATGSKS